MTPNKEQIKTFMNWRYEAEVDFWTTGGAGRSSNVIVSPQIKNKFMNFLETNKIKYELIVKNVEESLKAEKIARFNLMEKRGKLASSEPNFELYWSNEQMEAYTIRLAQQFPSLVKRDVIGKSIEGRDISALRISSGSEFGKKPIIFIDTGTHAREWIGPHTVLYFVDQLVTNSSVTNELLDKVDYVVIPNVNPDGKKIYSTTFKSMCKLSISFYILFIIRLRLCVHGRPVLAEESTTRKLHLQWHRLEQKLCLQMATSAQQRELKASIFHQISLSFILVPNK